MPHSQPSGDKDVVRRQSLMEIWIFGLILKKISHSLNSILKIFKKRNLKFFFLNSFVYLKLIERKIRSYFLHLNLIHKNFYSFRIRRNERDPIFYCFQKTILGRFFQKLFKTRLQNLFLCNECIKIRNWRIIKLSI